MADNQTSLFGSERADLGISGELSLRVQPNRPLTKVQRTFNRLLARIEKLRAALACETRRLDAALLYYAQHLHPRQLRLTTLCKDILRALAPFLDNSRLLRKSERKTLHAIVADQLDMLVVAEGSLVDGDLRALFERVHRISFDRAEREGFEAVRSMMEEAFGEFGIDVDVSDYRQLAKVLHPDLEPDPERKQRKVALMQELTAAYHNNDLHSLLRLELAWPQREEGDAERLTDEKLAVYNQVLKEQADELQWELDQLPYHPRYHPVIVENGPFGSLVQSDGPAEAWRLDRMIADMEARLTLLRTDEALAEVRSAIRVFRAASERRL